MAAALLSVYQEEALAFWCFQRFLARGTRRNFAPGLPRVWCALAQLCYSRTLHGVCVPPVREFI